MELNNACAAALTGNSAGIAEKLAIFAQSQDYFELTKQNQMANPWISTKEYVELKISDAV